MPNPLIVLPLLFAAVTASAQSVHQRSADGFGATVMLTTDRDWESKWPPTPAATAAGTATVAAGEEMNIVFSFENPQRGMRNMVEVRCDLQMRRPDGSISLDAKDVLCFRDVLPANATGPVLTGSNLKFVAEAGDQLGTYTATAVLRDVVRGSAVTLEISFEHVAP